MSDAFNLILQRAKITPEPVLPSPSHPPRTLASQISSNRRRSILTPSNKSNISTSSSVHPSSSLTKEALETNSRLVSGESGAVVRGMSLDMVGRYLEGVMEESDEDEEMVVEKIRVLPTVAILKTEKQVSVSAPAPRLTRKPLGTSKTQNLVSTIVIEGILRC